MVSFDVFRREQISQISKLMLMAMDSLVVSRKSSQFTKQETRRHEPLLFSSNLKNWESKTQAVVRCGNYNGTPKRGRRKTWKQI